MRRSEFQFNHVNFEQFNHVNFRHSNEDLKEIFGVQENYLARDTCWGIISIQMVLKDMRLCEIMWV